MKDFNPEQMDWSKGLIPAIVQHACSGEVLMLAYMNREALEATLSTQRVTFFSRSRQCLWTKGETSGNQLDLVGILADCDGDTLRVLAAPRGPVCHRGTRTCFGDSVHPPIAFLGLLEGLIAQRQQELPDRSYTAKLFRSGRKRIAQKLAEEAVETALAAVAGDGEEVVNEAADLVYHLLVLLRACEVSLPQVAEVLARRNRDAWRESNGLVFKCDDPSQ